MSGVRERLEDEGRSGEDGRTVGAGELRKREPEGRRLKRQEPGRKMSGGTVPGVPGGDAERQRAQNESELCPACGRGWKTRAEAEGTAERPELGSGKGREP